MSTRVNWTDMSRPILSLTDYAVVFDRLRFKVAYEGQNGFQLVYLPSGHIVAEGTEIVAAVAQCYRSQELLDAVKQSPKLVEESSDKAALAAFLESFESSGAAN